MLRLWLPCTAWLVGGRIELRVFDTYTLTAMKIAAALDDPDGVQKETLRLGTAAEYGILSKRIATTCGPGVPRFVERGGGPAGNAAATGPTVVSPGAQR